MENTGLPYPLFVHVTENNFPEADKVAISIVRACIGE